MKIDNEFRVGVPIERAWEVLTDLAAIAPCLPGAQLTGVAGDVYSGKVKIKVGPVVSEYAGTAQFVEKDDAAYLAVIDAKGKDSRGAGNAAAMIRAQLRADGSHTVVTVTTDLNISGKIAQFGSGMIKEVSAKLLAQFVENLEAQLLAPAAVEPPPDASWPAAVMPPPLGEPAAHVPAAGSPVVAAPAESEPEPEPLDLMSLAGSSVYKRLLPLLSGLVIVVAVLVYLAVR